MKKPSQKSLSKRPVSMPLAAFVVFCGGVLGTAFRTALGFLQPAAVSWPYITFCVNLFGAFILGFLLEYLALTGKDEGSRKLFRLFAGTGVMGGFTTYGTFILEVDIRFVEHHDMLALAYAVISIGVGLVVAGLGVICANKINDWRTGALTPLPESFGEPDLDAPDAQNDPGNLESRAAINASHLRRERDAR